MTSTNGVVDVIDMKYPESFAWRLEIHFSDTKSKYKQNVYNLLIKYHIKKSINNAVSSRVLLVMLNLKGKKELRQVHHNTTAASKKSASYCTSLTVK